MLTNTCDLDFSHDHAELGAVLNGFSLTQNGTLATAIEKAGQAIDATYMSTARLVGDYPRSP
jgi:sorting nexin-41/42